MSSGVNKVYTLNDGNVIPSLGLGTWNSEKGILKEAVLEALKIGYVHIDCAYIYNNQREVGEAIKEAIDQHIVERKNLFVTSKLWNDHHRKEDVEKYCKVTLKDLGLDYLDLYLIHWPVSSKPNSHFPTQPDEFIDVPIEETWKAMESLVEKGLVKSVGVSNFSIHRIEEILNFCKIKPVVNQVECHPYLTQKPLQQFCLSKDILLTAYSPLGSPGRPSAFNKEDSPKPLMEDEKLISIAQAKHVSVAQVLIAWQLQNGNVVIPKSVTPERIKENFDAFKVILSNEEMDAIDALNKNARYVKGHIFYPSDTTGPIKTYDQLWN
ncbi:aldo-keto reductase family 1 member B1-like [Zophobas morio]|uniref:aldo-keto reductase family 1 member B1-like n=1 Tax=Zophobas morio TaxID=2755281 RepID=UPI00308272A1